MKKFLRNILLFILPVFALLIIIFFVPVNRKYAYAFINRGGCEGRSSWIYENIFEDTTPIDVAFMGTSHTMNAVNDGQIETLLNDSMKLPLHVKNIAYCGKGRNFDLVLARDLLRHKKVRLLILEIQQSESKEGHRDFLHIATALDLLTAPITGNKEFIPEIYKGFLVRLQYLREKAAGEDKRHAVDFLHTDYGYNGDNVVAPVELLQKAKKEAENPAPTKKGLNNYGMYYIGRIARLARETNTPLVFLYLPKYGYSKASEEIRRRYGQYGEVICSPIEIFNDPADWRDEEHVNAKGTNQIAHYLAVELANEIYHRNTNDTTKLR